MSSSYELQESGQITGPHSLVVLQQKAEILVLRPDHLVRLIPAVGDPGPWLPIREIPELQNLLFPRRALPRLATSAGSRPATLPVTEPLRPAFDPLPLSSGYELKAEGCITGPHSLVVLQQKAEILVLRPDHLLRLASTPDAPWLPIREIPELHDLLFPPRALPRLATSVTFEPENARVDAEQPATDVFKLLRENSAHQRAAESELLKDLGPRPNNRRRDYLILALALNVFVAAIGSFVGYRNPFLIGLWTMGNIGLVWVLYFVMDRY